MHILGPEAEIQKYKIATNSKLRDASTINCKAALRRKKSKYLPRKFTKQYCGNKKGIICKLTLL